MGFRYALIGASIMIACAMAANQFIAPKKTQKLSVSKLKEQCGQSYGEILDAIAPLLHTIADLQHDAVASVRAYCEGQAECFGPAKDKEHLAKYNSLLNKAAQLCQNFTSEITLCVNQINALKAV